MTSLGILLWIMVLGTRCTLKKRLADSEACTRRNDSAFAKNISELWKRSRLSAPEVQGLSATSGTGDILAHKFGKAGASGKCRKNASRDICRTKAAVSKYPEVYQTKNPFWDHEHDCQVMRLTNFLLIHEILEMVVLAGAAVLDEYTRWPDNPAMERTVRDWQAKQGIEPHEPCVGIGIWGDAAKFFTRDCVMLVLWNLVTGPDNQRFWFCACSKKDMCQCGCSGRCTTEAIFAVLKRNLLVMASGVLPTFRDDGVKF